MRKLLSLVLVALIAPVAGSKPSFAHIAGPWDCIYHVHPPFNPFIWECLPPPVILPYPVAPSPQPTREGDGGGEYYHIRSFSGGSGRQVFGSKCFDWDECAGKLRNAIEQCERVSVRGRVQRECKEHFRNEAKQSADYFR